MEPTDVRQEMRICDDSVLRFAKRQQLTMRISVRITSAEGVRYRSLTFISSKTPEISSFTGMVRIIRKEVTSLLSDIEDLSQFSLNVHHIEKASLRLENPLTCNDRDSNDVRAQFFR